MKLTKTTAYAAMSLGYLATRRQDGPVQARQVARHLGLPLDSTLKILQTLARQQLLRSQLGRSGGYHFHREPDEVSLLEVIEAIEGPIQTDLPLIGDRPALATARTRLQRLCDRTTGQLRESLAQYTIAHLIGQAKPALVVH